MSKRNITGASVMSELGAHLFCLGASFFCPFLVVCFALWVCSLAWFNVHQSAALAGSASTYGEAMSLVHAQEHGFVASPLLSGLKLVEDEQKDIQLFVLEYGQKQGTMKEFGPNTPLDKSIDTSQNLYDYSVRVTFHVSPLLRLSAVPFLGNVPLLGKRLDITCRSDSFVEHPSGLSTL